MSRQPKDFNIRPSTTSINTSPVKNYRSNRVSLIKRESKMTKGTRDEFSTPSPRDHTHEEFDQYGERTLADIKNSDYASRHQHDLPKSDINFNKHVDEVSKCRCNVCFEGRRVRKEHEDTSPEAAFFKGSHLDHHEDGSIPEKDFIFILKRLAPHKNVTNSLRLFIPDTACFIQGECRLLAFTGKDRSIRFIKQKDRLTLGELKKYFDERRRRRDEDFIVIDEGTRKQREDTPGATTYVNIQDNKDLAKSEYIKIEPKLESLPSLTLLGGSGAYGGVNLMKAGSLKKGMTIGKSQIADGLVAKEVGALRYQDDSVTMLTEHDFNVLLLKRKIDPVWRTIQYLQNSARIKKSMHTLQRVYFVYEREKENPLFRRALQEVRFLNGEIFKASEDYIPPIEEMRFEEELKGKNEKEYCLYLLYKIYHFLFKVYNIKITKMGGDFVRDESGFVWFINASRVQYEALDVDTDDDLPTKTLEAPDKDDLAQRLESHYKEVERIEAIRLLNNILCQHYENIKKYLSGQDLQEVYYEDSLTDEAFLKLHPNAPFGLADILRSRVSFDKIRTFIISDTRKILYPHRSRDEGKSLELLAKQTYAGCPPRIVPGMVIKRHKEEAPNYHHLAPISSKIEASSVLKQKERSLVKTPLTQSMSNHKRLRMIFNSTFVNTNLNIRPISRDSFASHGGSFVNTRKLSQPENIFANLSGVVPMDKTLKVTSNRGPKTFNEALVTGPWVTTSPNSTGFRKVNPEKLNLNANMFRITNQIPRSQPSSTKSLSKSANLLKLGLLKYAN